MREINNDLLHETLMRRKPVMAFDENADYGPRWGVFCLRYSLTGRPRRTVFCPVLLGSGYPVPYLAGIDISGEETRVFQDV